MSEKIKNNWYKILELEYYPNPVEDEDVIRDRIEDKKAFWAKKRNDFSKGKEYTKYLELENKKVIEEEMLDPENNKRKEMIRELQNILFKAVDDMLEFCEGEYISSKVVKEFSKQEGMDEKLIKIRLKEKGKRIEEYRNPIYEKYCENLKKKITNYDNSKKNLDLLGKKNLYDFLNSEGIYFQSETDTEKILEKIEERRKKLVKSDAETSAKKELLSECHLIFKNAQKKREYDEYVEHLKYLEVSKELEKLKILSENSDFLNLSNKSFKYLKKIEEILRNKEEAKNIFVGFCRAERIPYTVERDYKNTENENKKSQEDEEEKYERNYNSDSNDTENENRRSQEDRKERYRRNYNSNSNENKSERAEVKMNAKDAKVLFYLSLVCLFWRKIIETFSFLHINFNGMELDVIWLVIVTIIFLICIKSILIKKSRLLNYRYPFYYCLIFILNTVLIYFFKTAKMIEISQAFGNAIIILGSTGTAFFIMSLIKNCPYVFDENFEVTEKSQMKISFWMNGIFLLIFLLFGFLILINDYDYLNLFKVFGIILVSLMTCLNFENKSSSYYICLLMYFILVFLNFNNMYETTPYNIVLVVLIILVLYRIKNINPYNKK